MKQGRVLLVLCGIVLAVALYLLRNTPEQKSAIDVLIENGKESLSPDRLHLIDSLERDYKRNVLTRSSGVPSAKNPANETLHALQHAWLQADNVQVAAVYALHLAESDTVFVSWFAAGVLLDSAFRSPRTASELRSYFLRMATTSLEHAQALDHSSLHVKVRLAGLYADGHGEVMKAVTLLREVVEADSLHVLANLRLGEFSMMSGQYDGALRRFQRVVSADSNNADGLIGLANANLALGRQPDALDLLTRANELLDTGSVKAAVEQMIIELKN